MYVYIYRIIRLPDVRMEMASSCSSLISGHKQLLTTCRDDVTVVKNIKTREMVYSLSMYNVAYIYLAPMY